ncbi:MAG: type III secretion system translocon subunit SctB, partial [Kiritimatiellae bacterium]|nr:type III secretion system translocon subunit SctB [Kiritimatiellia bacterium]
MSIEVNAGTRAVNWESLLSSLGQVEKTGAADGKTDFTITTKVDGEVKTMTVSIPDDLELPESIDKGVLDGLVDKLANANLGFTDEQIAKMKDSIAELYGAAGQAISDVNAKSRGNLLFDLYALMALLIDVAQSQRDAARDMRTAQNLAIQKSIQDQADKQREAARVGMILGIVCGAASALASGITMGLQGIAASQQNKIASQSGADAAKMHS